MSTWTQVAIISALPALAMASHARAQDDPAISSGHTLLMQNRCDQAATILRGAWDTTHLPRAAAELGRAEACLGRWSDAEAHLQAALAQSADLWVRARSDELRQNLEQVGRQLGTLVVDVEPGGARILVNAHPASSGQPIRAAAGTVVISASAAGHYDMDRRVDVAAGETRREHIVLVPLPSPATPEPPAPSSPTDHAPPVTSRATSSSALSEHPRRRGRGHLQRTLAWVALASVGVAATGATVALAIRDHNLSIWNDDSRCNRLAGPSRDQECPDEADAWRTAGTWMAVGYVASGVLAVGSLVLFLTAPSDDGDQTRSLRCVPVVPGGMTCEVRF